MNPNHAHRGTILLEDAKILSIAAHPGEQYILRLEAPRIATLAEPGSFVHLRCEPTLAMRRPMSIMRADPAQAAIEVLFKVHGTGTRALSARQAGDTLSLLGPIGKPFELRNPVARPLLIGGGVGIPPMIFIAERLRRLKGVSPLVLMGSEVPFPFTSRPSQILVPGMPDGVIATLPLLEDWGIACRLASRQAYPGCFDGLVTELAGHWIEALAAAGESAIEIFACGPTPMLKAVAALAARYSLPAQISLEEYMACAVGGCAGCTVRIETPTGPAMKRVCVDGPVFDASTVVFQ